ncbi:MAG: Omp28-related outer membrane protein [Candidatus Kapaibacterium sp.]
MKRFSSFAAKGIALAAMLLSIGAGTMSAQTPVKRVLVEEGTGAWCGFCPRGATTLINTIEKYPGKVIGVAVHNGGGTNDAMTTKEEAAYSSAFINGFPNMTIDRKRFSVSGTKIGVSDGAIVAPIVQQMATAAKVDVQLENVAYNSGTRTITADVKGIFAASVSGDIRFNLYIVEDSVKGNGAGYDQHNYMSKTGSAPDPNSPWYNFPPTITNFYHRHVLRAMVGGTWGDGGVIATSVQNGDSFTKTYTYKVPAGYNVNRISLVGIVQMYDGANVENRQILNAVEQGLFETKLPTIGVNGSVTSPYLTAAANSKIEKKVTFTNPNDKDVEVNIAIDFDNSEIPGGWATSVEPTTAVIPANGSIEATMKMNPDDALELAKVVITATPNVTDAIGAPGSAKVYVLSDQVKYAVMYGFNSFVKPYSDAVSAIDNNNIGIQSKIFNWSTEKEACEAYRDQFNVVILSFSGGDIASGSLSNEYGLPISVDATANADYPNMTKYIKGLMDAGKRVFVSAPNSLWWNQQTGATNADATAFFNMLGVDLAKANAHYTKTPNGNQIQIGFTTFNVRGVTGEIFNGMTATGNSTPNLGYTFWTNSMKLQAGSKSVPVFTLGTNATDIVGVRYEAENKARIVFVTFDMQAFGNMILQQDLMDKAINWLGEGLIAKVKKPVIADINAVEFETVTNGQTKDMPVVISNTGDGDLVITKISIAGDQVFTVKGVSLPLTVKAGEKATINITFAPTAEKEYMAFLQITSNNNNTANDVVSVDLSGRGLKPTSVFTPAEEATTIIGMTAGPNPASNKSVLNYTVGGTAPQFVEIYVVNSLGQRVAELGSQMRTPGNYTASINAAGLASGSYRIVAHTAVETVQLPFVVNR